MGVVSAAPVRTLHVLKDLDLSIRILAAVWNLSLGNSTDKLVLAALADYASDAGRCFPGLEALSLKTELSKRAIRESINRLKASGYLEVTHRHRHSSVFELQIEVIHKGAPSAAKSDSGVRQMPLLAALGAILAAPSAARTVKDPSLNLRERNRYSDNAERAELEAEGRDLCFRIMMPTDTCAEYRAALKRFKAENAVTVAHLQDAVERRRAKS